MFAAKTALSTLNNAFPPPPETNVSQVTLFGVTNPSKPANIF